jgi:hypothetical protein
MIEVKKDDKLIYKGSIPYILADGNSVEKEGDIVNIRSDIKVQKRFFELVKETPIVPIKKDEKKEVKIDKKQPKKNRG